MFFSPGKWTPISAVISRWLDDPHDLHRTTNLTRRDLVLVTGGAEDRFNRTVAKG
jgi:hypothetical protein